MSMAIWILVFLHCATISVFGLTADEIEAQRSGWDVSPNTQYHIQTDEGPERYFRFQTLSGQYRKEKRLEDGTVVGTEGWLDPLGYLRIKDYVADDQGFRILRSKTVFVGKDRPIQDAVSVSKKVPADSGILVKPQRPPNPFRQPELKDVPNSIEANTVTPLRSSTTSLESSNHYTAPSSTAVPYTASIPESQYEDGYLKPNTNYLLPGYQFQSPYVSPYRSPYPYHIPPPAVLVQPPVYDESNGQASQQLPVQVVYQPNSLNSSTQQTNYNPAGYQEVTPVQIQRPGIPGSQEASARSPIQASSSAASSSAISQQLPLYDGVHSTANGFQYYLKSHYHEEEKQPNDKKVGSFGYVDPFGIRRVIYYSADPQSGFLHKKNNRYVGFNASPYDPLPPSSH
ncbi:uncharacterized protein LOC107273126 isoform X2 [Cephus cinctus]|uniref:Uncharacterized protein LOC107273126 isoform X2 n=1 Tax=Cephus cinctus TaxID=211228 RepID=A0AAJ7FSV2_CEPCN|nr:uncharacterized protein LOC107273126 isoform X2 [Cephus cinctus]XP_015606657.1 uncharacterized protein LOC107273126 isoform X2 [Cephus cinctus]